MLPRKQAKSDAANKGGIREKRSVKDAFGDDGDAQNELNERRKKLKSSRLEALLNDDAPLPPTLPEPAEVITPVNAAQVSAIMADMKRRMQERKRQIGIFIVAFISCLVICDIPCCPTNCLSKIRKEKVMLK